MWSARVTDRGLRAAVRYRPLKMLSFCASTPTVMSDVDVSPRCTCQLCAALTPEVTRRSGWANWSPLTGSFMK